MTQIDIPKCIQVVARAITPGMWLLWRRFACYRDWLRENSLKSRAPRLGIAAVHMRKKIYISSLHRKTPSTQQAKKNTRTLTYNVPVCTKPTTLFATFYSVSYVTKPSFRSALKNKNHGIINDCTGVRKPAC